MALLGTAEPPGLPAPDSTMPTQYTPDRATHKGLQTTDLIPSPYLVFHGSPGSSAQSKILEPEVAQPLLSLITHPPVDRYGPATIYTLHPNTWRPGLGSRPSHTQLPLCGAPRAPPWPFCLPYSCSLSRSCLRGHLLQETFPGLPTPVLPTLGRLPQGTARAVGEAYSYYGLWYWFN